MNIEKSLEKNPNSVTENLYTPDSIRTVSGNYVNLLDPDPETIDIEDIAHALAHIPRFGGHPPYFYSVAQHSICCSRWGRSDRYEMLMHDISEAYLHDVSSPLKKHLPDYKAIEHRMNLVLAKKFGFQYPFPAAVKKIDRRVLEWEWKEIMLTQQPQVEYFSFQKWKKRFLYEYQNLRK